MPLLISQVGMMKMSESTIGAKEERAQKIEEQRKNRPEWLKVTAKTGKNYTALKDIMRTQSLHTVCEEAHCPNIFECWEQRTATFMILGDICTRACRFCAVHTGRPTELDLREPKRVAEAVVAMGLEHVVITSVARDDLADGGASMFAATIREVRKQVPSCSVEVLIPDFDGNWDALRLVMDAEPDILNHNVETVRRLSDSVRSRAKYDRTLELLRRAKEMKPDIPTKSSIMVGVGETMDEIYATMDDLRAVDVDILTIGQYLQPTEKHLVVERFYTPTEFLRLRGEGLKRGFRHVESGPMVRSSYHAKEQVPAGARKLR
ncbi:lipoyl synthase [Alicyclobacillus hesperidum URH17-3-68]|uniref:Lipoyl synthase n=2 Tax=Alicyclobacillus hesperidum TaxID=89784 RepID=A0A1H2T2I4_9BACL|nr:lipoyl synthase [Alicyclobacillus hesperidum URH17-3-68]GLV13727.1 lipoyl synthase [Alicyclobacillus hesperidum]SDW38068.1 lipoic acid synthetase [Alicyclobacillus hesperidum]